MAASVISSRSRRTLAFLPLMVVRFMASMTSSTAALGTPTVEKLSVMLIGPISRPLRWVSLAMAPTRSLGRTPSARPSPT